jgi:hypothetical protein
MYKQGMFCTLVENLSTYGLLIAMVMPDFISLCIYLICTFSDIPCSGYAEMFLGIKECGADNCTFNFIQLNVFCFVDFSCKRNMQILLLFYNTWKYRKRKYMYQQKWQQKECTHLCMQYLTIYENCMKL